MTVVKVATISPYKLEAIIKAFQEMFLDEIRIDTKKVMSGVPEQPVNDQVYQGAENRLNNLKEIVLDENETYDYLVSCEGGLIRQYGQWFNVHVVMIEDKFGRRSIGLSQAYPIPQKYVTKIIKTSLAHVLDEIFDKKGGVRQLTRGQMTRVDLINSGTIMALTGLVNEW